MNIEKHRLLNVGETMQSGDEFLATFPSNRWVSICREDVGSEVTEAFVVRRTFTPAELHAHEMAEALLWILKSEGNPLPNPGCECGECLKLNPAHAVLAKINQKTKP